MHGVCLVRDEEDEPLGRTGRRKSQLRRMLTAEEV